MIIWLNGAFGAGKTTCARVLAKQLPNAHIYDPEIIGECIHNSMPKNLQQDDFQKYPEWRNFNYQMLKTLAQQHNGPIIVPMTIATKQYYDEIITRLKHNQIPVSHFILTVKKDVLEARLNQRGSSSNWAKAQIDRCLEAFEDEIDGIKIPSDEKSIDDVVDAILVELKATR